MRLVAGSTRGWVARLAVTGMGALALSGCQSVESTSPNSPQVRFVAASPDAPGLDFYLDKTAQVYNLGYNVQTNYIPVNAGTYTVSAKVDQTTQTLASTTLGVKTAQHYTVLAGNVKAGMQLTALADQNSPAPSGQMDVRLIDQSPSAGAVDVYFVPSGGKLTTSNPVATALTFGANTGYIAIPADTYEIVVLPAGTVPIATTVASYTGAQATYSAGAVETFIIDDNSVVVTTPTLQVTTLNDYPTQ